MCTRTRRVFVRSVDEVAKMSNRTYDPEAQRVRVKIHVNAREGSERGATTANLLAILRAKDENGAKNNGGGLDARSDGGIRERNERYATIKPECRGAPRPRETPKFSSIFLSQEERVGAEDAFAITAVLL